MPESCSYQNRGGQYGSLPALCVLSTQVGPGRRAGISIRQEERTEEILQTLRWRDGPPVTPQALRLLTWLHD